MYWAMADAGIRRARPCLTNRNAGRIKLVDDAPAHVENPLGVVDAVELHIRAGGWRNGHCDTASLLGGAPGPSARLSGGAAGWWRGDGLAEPACKGTGHDAVGEGGAEAAEGGADGGEPVGHLVVGEANQVSRPPVW